MDKKTIILGLVAVVVIAGGLWYFNKGDNQIASILGGDNSNQENEVSQLGEFVLGDPSAPVTMIDYSSHTCGHCIDFHLETLPILIEKYVKTGKLKIIPRLVSPLELNMATFCAYEQERRQEYSDYLFEHISEIETTEELKDIAGELGFDRDGFNACYDTGKYQEEIMSVFEQAQVDGVEGTPTFIINGERIIGNQPIEVFEEAIEKALNQ